MKIHLKNSSQLNFRTEHSQLVAKKRELSE
jgi:hypothetical protein